MFLCWAQADDTNSIFVGALRKNHHMKPSVDQAKGDKADFSILKAIILAL
jgi:hypothetical protein